MQNEKTSHATRGPEFTLAAERLPNMSLFGSRTNERCWREAEGSESLVP